MNLRLLDRAKVELFAPIDACMQCVRHPRRASEPWIISAQQAYGTPHQDFRSDSFVPHHICSLPCE
jgi:hypothetical protein